MAGRLQHQRRQCPLTEGSEGGPLPPECSSRGISGAAAHLNPHQKDALIPLGCGAARAGSAAGPPRHPCWRVGSQASIPRPPNLRRATGPVPIFFWAPWTKPRAVVRKNQRLLPTYHRGITHHHHRQPDEALFLRPPFIVSDDRTPPPNPGADSRCPRAAQSNKYQHWTTNRTNRAPRHLRSEVRA